MLGVTLWIVENVIKPNQDNSCSSEQTLFLNFLVSKTTQQKFSFLLQAHQIHFGVLLNDALVLLRVIAVPAIAFPVIVQRELNLSVFIWSYACSCVFGPNFSGSLMGSKTIKNKLFRQCFLAKCFSFKIINLYILPPNSLSSCAS